MRFTQDSIGANFKNGKSVQSLVDDLKTGKVTAGDLPPIRIFQKDGKIYSLDNRRLHAAQEAGVNVRFVRASPADVQNESWKFTTKNDGSSIVVRGK
ncbi:hypothetical protein ABZ464_27500 [Streptomyces sp. NPDC005820]|uniref:hypothetical protein n=1 Tax=Streptomyces sp. NPDC005820 TaxID=3157069 RepID=UPI0033E9A7F0